MAGFNTGQQKLNTAGDLKMSKVDKEFFQALQQLNYDSLLMHVF